MHKRVWSFVIGLMGMVVASHASAQTTVENPQPDANVSGISLISGWRCSANAITVSFDGGTQYPVSYGTIREDTALACGDTNNGFGFLWNWGRLSNGSHTVRLFDNGTQFSEVNVNVTNYGAEFLSGHTNSTLAPNFPADGQTATLEWQQSLQSFVITSIDDTVPPANGVFTGTGNFELQHCTVPANDGTTSFSQLSMESHTGDDHGFVGGANFPLNALTVNLTLYGVFFRSTNGFTGGVLGTAGNSEGAANVDGTFDGGISGNNITLSYQGLVYFGGSSLCRFKGDFSGSH